MNVSNVDKTDTIKFSYIGYESYSIPINELVSAKNKTIYLNPKITELNQVVISAEKLFQILGNQKVGRRYTGWGDIESQKGRIKGLLVEGAECPVKVKSLSFRLNHNDWDSVVFRINFLNVEDNFPSESILNENIFITTDKKRKWIKVDLDRYNILICEKAVVSLEWVDAWGMIGEYSNLLTISLSKNDGYTLSQDPGQEIGTFKLEDNAPAIFLEVYRN